jgi:AcrR family transcriptional regulator
MIYVLIGMKREKVRSTLGRPRAFDVEKTLHHAMQVFWRKGYLGTSLSDLTNAMGINRPSLYAAFGNKESLFRKALDHYAKGPSSYLSEALQEPKTRAVVERLLHGVVAIHGRRQPVCGCMARSPCIEFWRLPNSDVLRHEKRLTRLFVSLFPKPIMP